MKLKKKVAKKAKATAKPITRSALEAWEHFRDIGGLDLESRDLDLESQLRLQIDRSAPTLYDALAFCTTDELVRAFFAITAPFTEMFRDIVAFFKQAGADRGREQWVIKIDEDHIDLKAFQKFLKIWEKVEGPIEIPAVDDHGLRIVLNIPESQPWWQAPAFKGAITGLADVDAWLADYKTGIFGPYPRSLLPSNVPPALADAAAVVWASTTVLMENWATHAEVDHAAGDMFSGRSDDLRYVASDGFAPGTLAQWETDFQPGRAVAVLATLVGLPGAHLAAIEQPLKDAYAQYGRRTMQYRADVLALEAVLSLPVWRARDQLYAVWIAVETIRDLDDHMIDLHHEDGQITFAFKETVVATITTTRPEKRLIAERRTPLQNPTGHGRVSGVQPDFGIWEGTTGVETCGLIIEVKHYLKPAASRFKAVLNDYARAHPEAQIVLVNHGPAKDMTEGVDSDVQDRCHTIGDLTTLNKHGRAKLKTLVRSYVGNPVSAAAEPGAAVFVIDISGSMQNFLTKAILKGFFDRVSATDASRVILIDYEVRSDVTVVEVWARLPFPYGPGTALADPIRALQVTHSVELLTDSDGIGDLQTAGISIDRWTEIQPGLYHVSILPSSH